MKHTESGIPVIFGEVLFDRFPDGSTVLGGAPFNVAWNLKALGAEPVLVSRIGTDKFSSRITSAMKEWGLDSCGMQQDAHHPTGTVEVTLQEGEPRFDIAMGKAYDFITPMDLPLLPPAGVLYHGTLALRSDLPLATLSRLRQVTSAPVFVDVNLRKPWWQPQHVISWLQEARWIKLNEEELAQLVPDEPDLHRRAERLMGETLMQCLIVTRGEKGVWFRDRQGIVLEPPSTPAGRVVDTVGAGDAFSSVIILGLMGGWSWSVILGRAQEFAAAVVGLHGATTQDKKFYEPFTRSWELDHGDE